MNQMMPSPIVQAGDTTISDESIIDKILNGDKNAYEVIIRRYNGQLYKIARTYVKDEDQIEDLIQETYIKAYENLPKFRRHSKLSTWLVRILINQALLSINKASRKDKLHDNMLVDQMPHVPSQEQNIIRNNIKEILEKAIDQLPEKYSVVFVMRVLEGFNIKETATCLDISEENVKVRLHRAKTMLKEMISVSLGGVDLFTFGGARCNRVTARVMRQIRK